MDVSVIIVTYNRQKDCREAICSALNQEVKPYEIVVIDDASESSFHFEHPKVKVVRNELELGLGASRNIGIRVAKGDIIAFTDDDAIVSSTWIKAIQEAFERDIDVAGGPVMPLYLSPLPNWWDANAFSVFVGVHNSTIIGCNLAVRKNLFEKIGYFNERLGRRHGKLLSNEEVEFFMRILKAQGRIEFSDKIIVHHKVYPERTTMLYLLKRSWYQGVSDRLTYPVEIRKIFRRLGQILSCLLRILIDPKHARNYLLLISKNTGYLSALFGRYK